MHTHHPITFLAAVILLTCPLMGGVGRCQERTEQERELIEAIKHSGGDVRVDAARPGLLEVYPETLVEISLEDAARICLNGRTRVRVRSRREEMLARTVVTKRVAAGVFVTNILRFRHSARGFLIPPGLTSW
jgi:hypothetical protein